MITLENISEIFILEEPTGTLVWRTSPNKKIKPGAVAGKIFTTKEGLQYRSIRYRGKDYLAHRLVWMMAKKEYPPKEIDHRDGDGLNNRPDNLRDGTFLNSLNRRRYSNNTSGVSGIIWHSLSGKWQVYPQVKGKRKSLGLFSNLDEALKVLLEFRESHPEITSRHGTGETHFEHQKASRND